MAVGDELYLKGDANRDKSVRLLEVADTDGDGVPDHRLQVERDGRWLDSTLLNPASAATDATARAAAAAAQATATAAVPSTRAWGGAQGAISRGVDTVFAALPSVSAANYGATLGLTGDGVTNRLSAPTVSSKATFSGAFTAADRLHDMDTDDTEAWLAIQLAIWDLCYTRGTGGSVYIPRPRNGPHMLGRFLHVPAGYPLRIFGDGYHPDIYDIDMNVPSSGGWYDAERRVVFQLSNFKLQAMVVSGTGACTQVACAAVALGNTSIIPLATGGGATFAVGNRVVIFNTDNFTSGATVCPYRMAFRKVADISTDTLLLDEPIPFTLASGKGRVALMGTGSDSSYGNAPYDYCEGFVVEGLHVRGAGLLGYGNACRGGAIRDVGLRSDRAVVNANNAGIQLNGFTDYTVDKVKIVTQNRGIEVKCGSGGRYGYRPDDERGGTGLLIRDVAVRQIGATASTAPLISLGESSNLKLENIRVVGGPAMSVAFGMVKFDDVETVIVRGLQLDTQIASSIAFQPIGHKSPLDRAVIDVQGVKMGGANWVRDWLCQNFDGRAKPVLLVDDVEFGGTFTTFIAVAGVFQYNDHYRYTNRRSSIGETIGYLATSLVIGSHQLDALGCTGDQLKAIAGWINTGFWKKQGRPVVITAVAASGEPATVGVRWYPTPGSADPVAATPWVSTAGTSVTPA